MDLGKEGWIFGDEVTQQSIHIQVSLFLGLGERGLLDLVLQCPFLWLLGQVEASCHSKELVNKNNVVCLAEFPFDQAVIQILYFGFDCISDGMEGIIENMEVGWAFL